MLVNTEDDGDDAGPDERFRVLSGFLIHESYAKSGVSFLLSSTKGPSSDSKTRW